MNEDRERIVSVVEWVVLAIVVFSTVGMEMDFGTGEDIDLEVSNISGSVILSTRSSMDAIGLDEYDRGAIATLDIDVRTVLSEGCSDCVSSPIGTQLYGSVVISNIKGEGGLGRIESILSITYLQEFLDEDLVIREWLNVDWDAGSESIHLQLVMAHDPPRWVLDDRFHASFISVDGGKESRVGPWLFVETLLNRTVNLRGCLPDAFTCGSNTVDSINLTSTFEEIKEPLKVQYSESWELLQNVSSSDEDPNMFVEFRQMSGADSEIEFNTLHCPSSGDEVLALKSWEISNINGPVVAPLTSWFEAFELSGPIFYPSGGFWTEAEYYNGGCGGLVDHKGQLRFGIYLIRG